MPASSQELPTTSRATSSRRASARFCRPGPVTALWHASVLQHHPHVSVLVDENAARGLRLAGYYRQTYADKPSWQAL